MDNTNNSIDIPEISDLQQTFDDQTIDLNKNVTYTDLSMSDNEKSAFIAIKNGKSNAMNENANDSKLSTSISSKKSIGNETSLRSIDLTCEDTNITLPIDLDELPQTNESKIVIDEVIVNEKLSNTLRKTKDSFIEQPNQTQNCSTTNETEIDTFAEGEECNWFENNLQEIGRRLWTSSYDKQQYTKGCIWSPDGTCILVPINSDGMHIIEVPQELYTPNDMPVDHVSNLSTAVHVKEGGTVYDCAWYPYMNSSQPETCCWIATRQHEPIHMWDAFNGELRCSYRGYDAVDEVESAISLKFTDDGTKIIAGYKKSIKVFDTNVPGFDFINFPVKNAISCFAGTSDHPSTITTGTWRGYINHYDLRQPQIGPLFTLGGHSCGITLLRYTLNGHNWELFSGARKDKKILQWDMRNYTEPIYVFERTVETNQRIFFDLSPSSKWLVSGNTNGAIKIWNLETDNNCIELKIHNDCCNGVNFHPTLPILATSSGQYHYIDVVQESNKNAIEETLIDYENCLMFLWCGKSHHKTI